MAAITDHVVMISEPGRLTQWLRNGVSQACGCTNYCKISILIVNRKRVDRWLTDVTRLPLVRVFWRDNFVFGPVTVLCANLDVSTAQSLLAMYINGVPEVSSSII